MITRMFWNGWRKHIERAGSSPPAFVIFNGRFFDLPVMELARREPPGDDEDAFAP